jgi:hypothetical protein
VASAEPLKHMAAIVPAYFTLKLHFLAKVKKNILEMMNIPFYHRLFILLEYAL